jgi:SPFH domain / Band 7 family
MLRQLKLSPNERVLTVSPINRYKICGPGRVWLSLRQRVVAKIFVGPRGQSLLFEQVRTVEDVPLKIKAQVLVRVDPELFTADTLPKLPGLNDGGWEGVVRWQTEYVLRLIVAQQPWQRLNEETVQQRVERQLTQTLADRLVFVGLRVMSVALVNIELPADLQQTLVDAEQVSIEASGRARVLEQYRQIFGENLARVMPYIVQWELLNTIHKNEPNILLNASNLANSDMPLAFRAGNGSRYQIELPLQ